MGGLGTCRAPTVSTRQFLELIFREAGRRPRVQRVPKLVLRALGLVNANVRELVEMTYEFEEPFVVDHGAFARAFGDHDAARGGGEDDGRLVPRASRGRPSTTEKRSRGTYSTSVPYPR